MFNDVLDCCAVVAPLLRRCCALALQICIKMIDICIVKLCYEV